MSLEQEASGKPVIHFSSSRSRSDSARITLNFKELEHVLIEKVEQLFRTCSRPEGSKRFSLVKRRGLDQHKDANPLSRPISSKAMTRHRRKQTPLLRRARLRPIASGTVFLDSFDRSGKRAARAEVMRRPK